MNLKTYKKLMITGIQISAARALKGISQAELCEAVGISRVALSSIENGKREARTSNLQAIKDALEGHGIEFINEGASSENGGVGVRLKT